ncbi:MAG: DUF4410 domain-containing protein [Acetobacteraceae bacterium]
MKGIIPRDDAVSFSLRDKALFTAGKPCRCLRMFGAGRPAEWGDRMRDAISDEDRRIKRPAPPAARMLRRQRKTFVGTVFALVLAAMLGACAGSVAPPTTVLAFPRGERASLHLSSITADAGPGVAMTADDLNRIVEEVAAEIHASRPGVLMAPDTAQAKLMKITITRYDEGSAFARFMLAGLGQIYIEGDVKILDGATNQMTGEYKVSKDFAFGGLYGGVTTIRDVEKGFSRSVVAGINPNA